MIRPSASSRWRESSRPSPPSKNPLGGPARCPAIHVPRLPFGRDCARPASEHRALPAPFAFFDDAIFSPPLLPSKLTKPRTVCGCQPVAVMISARVAPLARFNLAITSAFLLVRSVFGAICFRLAVLLGPHSRFHGLGLLGGFPRALRCGLWRFAVGPGIDCVLAHLLLLPLVAVVTCITPLRRNSKRALRRLCGAMLDGRTAIGGPGLNHHLEVTQRQRAMI